MIFHLTVKALQNARVKARLCPIIERNNKNTFVKSTWKLQVPKMTLLLDMALLSHCPTNKPWNAKEPQCLSHKHLQDASEGIWNQSFGLIWTYVEWKQQPLPRNHGLMWQFTHIWDQEHRAFNSLLMSAAAANSAEACAHTSWMALIKNQKLGSWRNGMECNIF